MTRDDDVWRLPPVPAPEAPAQGMRFWLQTGTHWSIGLNYSVGRVNSRSFYLASEGRRIRHPLSAWGQWLRDRMGEGLLVLDGHPVVPAAQVTLGDGVGVPVDAVPPEATPLDLHSAPRRRRLRALLQGARFLPEAGPDAPRVRVSLGRRACAVVADPAWARPVGGDCAEARGRDDGMCLHAVAVCLRDPALRGRLLRWVL